MSDFQLSGEMLKLHKKYDDSKISENESRTKASFKIGWVTYCFDINNAADMMPLVFEAGINLNSEMANEKEWAASSKDLSYCWTANWQVIHSNPLRAAAIVYLLMRGE